MNYSIFNGDCLKVLPELGYYDTIFADPPDNINLKYNKFKDKKSEHLYLSWLESCIDLFIQKADSVWVSFNYKWTIDMGAITKGLARKHNVNVKTCVQIFTFGQHNNRDLGNGHRPLWRFTKKDATFYPDSIRIESRRQLAGDARANPLGSVPLDVFDFTRVTGNSKQRRKWHPTQLNEDLVRRAVSLTSPVGGHVLDPFGGTGTTLRVCKDLKINCDLIELDPDYCRNISVENDVPIYRRK